VSTRLYAPKRYRHRGYTTVRLPLCVSSQGRGTESAVCDPVAIRLTRTAGGRVKSCTRRDPGGRSKRGPSCTIRSFYPRYLTLTPPLTINCQTPTGMKLLSAPAATGRRKRGTHRAPRPASRLQLPRPICIPARIQSRHFDALPTDSLDLQWLVSERKSLGSS